MLPGVYASIAARAAVATAIASLAILLRVGPSEAEDAASPPDIRLAVLSHKAALPPLYEIDPTPEDEGVAGARLAIKDNNTTGAFTGQHYLLEEDRLGKGQSAADEARKLVDGGIHFLVADLPAAELLAVADAVKDSAAVIFNVQAQDDRLRGTDCRANVLHVAPSRSMVTDALVQFLATKRWTNLFLIVGPQPADRLYAEALRHSAKKFGLKIAAEKAWEFGALARARSDSVTQSEALVFTRGVDYDVMVVADEADDFGNYISYHTWDPKLVVGTQGLVATSWHQTLDAWGSAQLQNRFYKLAKRRMRPIDYQAWTAVRAVGEAVTRTKTSDPQQVEGLLLGGNFQLAAFKGVPVSFRPWDRQLRQPILIAQPMALVSVSPQPGFLHERTPLDTLGVDQPESECHLQ